MKKIKQHNKTQYIVLSLLAVVVVAAALIAIFHHKSHTSNTDQSPASNVKTETPADTNSQGNAAQTNSGKGTTPNTDYTPPTGDNNGITLTTSTSGDKVVVSTQLAGYSDGTCKLTATNGTKTNSQTANVIYAPSFSTCAGFTVPIDALGSGTWNIALAVTSGGTTNIKTTTYEVK